MARTKNVSNPNNMLWVLASLACDKTSDSQSSSTLNVVQQQGSMSDERDDQARRRRREDDNDNDNDSGPPEEIVVARRARRKPIKKRSLKVMKNDYQVHTVDVTGPRKKNKTILPYKIRPLSTMNQRMPIATRIVDDYNEEEAAMRNNEYIINKENTSANTTASETNRVENDLTVNDEDDDVSVMVCTISSKCDGKQWKKDHSPLQLPSFLPCPGVALRYVQSISLTIQER